MSDRLIEAMQRAAEAATSWPEKSVQLFHHNDADGLTSGAILTRAFERAGFGIHRFCLEKPYPAVLDRVFQQSGGLIVFADFAGRIAPLISDLNRGRNLVLILDHHRANPATDDMVHHLDPELFGLSGDRDISASTTCYLFASTLDAANSDLAPIATIGAVGDGFGVDGCLAGQNREVALESVRQGRIEIKKRAAGESYTYRSKRGPIACTDLASYLDTLGAAGYYKNGPEAGIRVCLDGIGSASDRMLKELQSIQRRAFEAQLRRLGKGRLKETDRIQWFHVRNRFSPMGVKMIGVFCEKYADSGPFRPDKFIAGFQTIPDNVPGFGRIPMNQVKISMRVSAYLAEKIRTGKAPGLDVFLPGATAKLGGFSDGCHRLKAATTIAVGKEKELIAEMEKRLTPLSPEHFMNIF
jgi:hypothetical protein